MKFGIALLRNRFVVIAHDLIMIPIAWFFAYWLRFNLSQIPDVILSQAFLVLPGILTIQAIAYHGFGLYRGVWRFASVPDLLRIIKAVTVGTLSCAILSLVFAHSITIPRSIFPLYSILLLILLGGPRMVYRWLKDKRGMLATSRILIVGAGVAGERMLRDILSDRQYRYFPVGFVDDDPYKKGVDIHGVRVIGATNDIPIIVSKHSIDLIIIAIPSANAATMRKVVEQCSYANVPFRTLPPANDQRFGQINYNALREVSLEDLLNRDAVQLDWESISHTLTGKTVLITGGGGSIGSELCRQVVQLGPSKLVVVENSEYNLYELDRELKGKYPHVHFHGFLVDILDRPQIANIIQKFLPDVIFHAAAYKHVPLLESQLRVAMRNNTLGTTIVAEEAHKANVKTFVLISTDKAVNPTNIMGASKRAAEIFCQNISAHSQTHFVTVRFGNVLGSAGSVVPLFRKQIEVGGPLTVTHPSISRFFMTVQEAVLLIMQAMSMGKGGEIFILDMGEPVMIRYLAEQMIRLAGFTPGKEIEIVYTGLRPGEKLFEELFHEQEELLPTTHHKILLSRHRQWEWVELKRVMDDLEIACNLCDESLIYSLLTKLVPEYQSNDEERQMINALAKKEWV